MRLLVHGASLAPGMERMRFAAMGLALRGHHVAWSGNVPEAAVMCGATPAPRGLARSRIHVDVVLGGSGAPLRTAAAGALAHAHCMVLGLEAVAVRGWGNTGYAAWDSLHASGLIEPLEATGIRETVPAAMLERLGLWSDEEPPSEADSGHADTEVLERACERALARHRGATSRGAAFLDRDGTLVVERGYLSDPNDIELISGVPEALKALRAAGLAIVVVSNQSGVGRGFFPLTRVHEAMARLRHELRSHGVELDAVYFCPHRPDAGCACRKPSAALLERAAEDLRLSLVRSVMVGDKHLDVLTGQAAGAAGVLVRTGYGRDEERRLIEMPPERAPDLIADDLQAACEWIVERGETLPA